MRITQIIERTVALEGAIANAVVDFSKHTVSLVALVSDQVRDGRPVVGFAFNSIGRFGQSGIIRERLIPRVLAADPEALLDDAGQGFDPAAVAAHAMRDEKPGGHGDRAGAVAALELAVWDLNAKLADEPAYANIAAHFGVTGQTAGTPVYAAGGYYYPDDSLQRLRDEIAGYQDMGYQAFKIKIGGAVLARDMQRVEAVIAMAGDASAVAVDANGRFELPLALEYARALAPLGVRWFEEPADPLDYALNRVLTEQYPGVIAAGENLFSTIDALNLVRFGGMRPQVDVLQMDPGLSYGLSAYLQTVHELQALGFSRSQFVPHGGHLINLHIVSALGLGACEAYPGVFQPFGGYSPGCTMTGDGIRPSGAPGFGLEEKPELAPLLRQMRQIASG